MGTLDNTFYCGWKNETGAIFELQEVKAPTPFGAKYQYVKSYLTVKYPDLSRFKVNSLIPFIYAGTTANPAKREELDDKTNFYDIVAVH